MLGGVPSRGLALIFNIKCRRAIATADKSAYNLAKHLGQLINPTLPAYPPIGANRKPARYRVSRCLALPVGGALVPRSRPSEYDSQITGHSADLHQL